MKWSTLTTLIPLGLGAGVILASVLRSKALFMAMPFVNNRSRPTIARFLRHHRLLMIFFLVTYLIMSCALVIKLSFVNEMLVGAICFLVATFIYLGSLLETKLLSEIQNTLHGLLPICARCKKMRCPDSDPSRPESWVEIQQYVTRETGKEWTHAYCPTCLSIALREIKDLGRISS